MPQAIHVIDNFAELSGQVTPAQLNSDALGYGLLPWQWPRLGTSRSKYFQAGMPMSASDPILYLGAGNSGVLRRVWQDIPFGEIGK